MPEGKGGAQAHSFLLGLTFIKWMLLRNATKTKSKWGCNGSYYLSWFTGSPGLWLVNAHDSGLWLDDAVHSGHNTYIWLLQELKDFSSVSETLSSSFIAFLEHPSLQRAQHRTECYQFRIKCDILIAYFMRQTEPIKLRRVLHNLALTPTPKLKTLSWLMISQPFMILIAT